METELERMLVRIVGDITGLKSVQEKVGGLLNRMAQDSRTTAAEINRATQQVTGLAQGVVGALGMLGLASSLQSAFKSYSELEQGQIRLKATIEAGGHSAATVIPQYTKFADTIAQATLVTKGQTMSMLQQVESMGYSGEAAQRIVQQSIALGGATNQSAESMVRMMVAVERGNFTMLRRLQQFRGLKDQTEILTKLNQLLTGGWQTQMEIANTASGRLERLGRSFKFISTEIGGMVAKAILPFVERIQNLIDWIKSLDAETKKMIVQIGGITLAVLALSPALRLISTFVWPFVSLAIYLVGLSALIIKKTILIGIWLIWKALLLITAILIFTVAAAVALFSIKSLILSGVILAVKVATWLWNAALTVMNILLSPVLIVAFVAALVVLAAIFALVAATVSGVVAAIGALITGVGSLFSAMKGLGGLGSIFSDWMVILKGIWDAMRTNMPLAMQMIKLAFTVIVEDVKSIVSPLWEFLKEGFSAVADYMSAKFAEKFKEVAASSLRLMQAVSQPTATAIATLFGLANNQEQQQIAKTDEAAKAMDERIKKAAQGFSVTESDARRRARQELESLMGEAGNTARANQTGMEVGRAMNQGIAKELGKFDSVLFGSAEAAARLQAQARSISEVKSASNDLTVAARYPRQVAGTLIDLQSQGPLHPSVQSSMPGGAPSLYPYVQSSVQESNHNLRQRSAEAQEALLREIRDELRRAGRQPENNIALTNLGG